jgi:hypothetical protein
METVAVDTPTMRASSFAVTAISVYHGSFIAPCQLSLVKIVAYDLVKVNQQPRRKRTGYVGSDRYGFYAGSNTPDPIAEISTKTAPRLPRVAGSWVLDPRANKNDKNTVKPVSTTSQRPFRISRGYYSLD